MNIPKPILTREHGSWAVLIVPIITGAALARSYSWNLMWFTLSALGIFLSYVPAATILREVFSPKKEYKNIIRSTFWFRVYGGFSITCSIPLLLQYLWYLPAIALLAIGFFAVNVLLTMKLHKSVISDFIAVAGLTLGAPGAYYTLTGKIDASSVILWCLNILFFGCSVFYVHMKIQAQKIRRDSPASGVITAARRQNIMYQFGTMTVVVIMAMNHLVPAFIIIAFLPMTVHSLVGTVRRDRRVNFKNLGFVLLAHSVLFTTICIWKM